MSDSQPFINDSSNAYFPKQQLDLFQDEFEFLKSPDDINDPLNISTADYASAMNIPQQDPALLDQMMFQQNHEAMFIPQNPHIITPPDNVPVAPYVKPVLKTVASMPNIKPADFSMPPKSENTPSTRKRIPAEKTMILEEAFQMNPKPDRERRDALAKQTDLPIRNIQVSA